MAGTSLKKHLKKYAKKEIGNCEKCGKPAYWKVILYRADKHLVSTIYYCGNCVEKMENRWLKLCPNAELRRERMTVFDFEVKQKEQINKKLIDKGMMPTEECKETPINNIPINKPAKFDDDWLVRVNLILKQGRVN